MSHNGDIKNYCVFCSASETVSPAFFDVATNLGKAIAAKKGVLIYGGGHVGLMGEVARSAQRNGGTVVGVSVDAFEDMGVMHTMVDELVIVPTMAERKQIMFDRADAFIVLPGGFGTLDETSEVLTLKQLDFHRKPIVFVNVDGFFNPLLAYFEELIETNFARPSHRALFYVAPDVLRVITYLENYTPPEINGNWFVTNEEK